MTWSQRLARWLSGSLGFENATSVDDVRLSFGSEWARNGPAWVLFGCIAACLLAGFFYTRAQTKGRRSARIALGVTRGVLLCLLILILADPILQFRLTSQPKPALWVLVDGTDSMAIADEYPAEVRSGFETAVDWRGFAESRDEGGGTRDDNETAPARADYVRALLAKDEDNLLERLAEDYRIRTYVFDRADGVRPLRIVGSDDEPPSEEALDVDALAAALTTDGQVSALGNAIEDIAVRHATSHLAGLLVVSDFAWNAGRAPDAAAGKLKVPVYTLGVGATSAVDLEVKLYADPKMKKAETSTVTVTLRQRELDGQTVPVRVVARRPEGDAVPGEPEEIVVGEREVALDAGDVTVEFPFRPEETGRWVFHAEVEPREGEIVEQNNRAEREVSIIDDFLRLLFVEYEPTYEWRFVKEVFHRDKLVGQRGFRTFLRSADPAVIDRNELFVERDVLSGDRKRFFEHDVIFLSDMPRETLNTRFMEMTREFVEKFGGGLVVIAGPRFGPGELADTPIADMLPVVLDPDGRLRDDRDFALRLTPRAATYDFMNLGDANAAGNAEAAEQRAAADNARAWTNLDRVPWYQPVKAVEPFRSTVLAEHPFDKCIDGKTPQPLIAIRKFGRGEVVYVGFNEMWRLRRKYGEKYYRRFWGQLIHRMGLSHALGSQKRFVVRTDRQRYDADDRVLITVEAYDEDFRPLRAEDLPTGEKVLEAELYRPGRAGEGAEVREPLRIAQSDAEKGLYEIRVPVFEGGPYRVVVRDPIAEDEKSVHFQVTSLSIERRKAVRNQSVQRNLALATGGKAYELDTIGELPNDFDPPRLTETTVKVIPLWSTWLCFTVLVGLMLTEWFVRKLVNLP